LATGKNSASSTVEMSANPILRRSRARTGAPSCETALYAPVKAFFERHGYAVKGEVRGCDLVACRGDETPVIVELKLRFNLALVLQGIDRLTMSERVYLAVPRRARPSRAQSPDAPAVRRLCRLLGLGLIVVGRRSIAIVEDPVPYRPRRAKRRIERLIDEFTRRRGDANVGGSAPGPIVTAYREEALRCAQVLAEAGAMRLAELRKAAGVPRAAQILQRNYYGWFARIGRGLYALTDAGAAALDRFAETLAVLALPTASPTALAVPNLVAG
jgi:hypothetical protein